MTATAPSRSLRTHIDDVIAGALALVADPVDGAEIEVDPEEMPETAWDRAMEARIDAYTSDRDDALLRLRHIRGAVIAIRRHIEDEAERLQARIRRLSRTEEYVQARALAVLQAERLATGGSEGERHKIAVAESYVAIRITRSKRVEIDDIDELPRSLVRVKVEPDKTQIKKRLESGAVVPGARLEERVTESVEWGR